METTDKANGFSLLSYLGNDNAATNVYAKNDSEIGEMVEGTKWSFVERRNE